mmetsp:Transcript_2206/g.5632  ORF Transcript_2206/g.5632 Transcript_2206/m.5632 type:complete len:213 (+) Transcript_2206:579-1217(+)
MILGEDTSPPEPGPCSPCPCKCGTELLWCCCCTPSATLLPLGCSSPLPRAFLLGGCSTPPSTPTTPLLSSPTPGAAAAAVPACDTSGKPRLLPAAAPLPDAPGAPASCASFPAPGPFSFSLLAFTAPLAFTGPSAAAPPPPPWLAAFALLLEVSPLAMWLLFADAPLPLGVSPFAGWLSPFAAAARWWAEVAGARAESARVCEEPVRGWRRT